MAVDNIARMMALDAAQQGGTGDSYTKAETDELLSKKPGEITTGKQYTIDGQTVTAGTGAEAFNNLTNKASGEYSHAEGTATTAFGANSHAEGVGTTASGAQSHAEGIYTNASSLSQHAQGKYNIVDTNNKFAFIIGNGTADNARHNAFAIDWDGLIYVNGAATGVDVAALAATIGDINAVLEEVL